MTDETYPAGRRVVTWDWRDDGGRHAAAGVYLYRFVSGNYRQTRKMVLLK